LPFSECCEKGGRTLTLREGVSPNIVRKPFLWTLKAGRVDNGSGTCPPHAAMTRRKPFSESPHVGPMHRESRLILALDVKDAATALRLAKECRGLVDAVKVGWPLTLAAGPQVVTRLASRVDVICDFKIADIPPIAGAITVAAFSLGAKGLICHGFPGEDSVRAVVEAARGDVFVVTEMSHPGGQQFTAPVAEDLARIAVKAGASGIVAPATRPERVRRLREIVGGLLILSPGAGAQGGTPSGAIAAGADYVIVGRAITEAKDPAGAARQLAEEIQTAAKH
jgi:orotidine-5'-phosphate decarboxylase